MKAEFYKMDYDAWDVGTVDLTLEQEAAYLRLCNQMYRTKGPIPFSTRLLQGLFRCGHARAKALAEKLIAAGKIHVTTEGLLSNERVLTELSERDALSNKRRVAAGGSALTSQRDSDPSPTRPRPTSDQTPSKGGPDHDPSPTRPRPSPAKSLISNDGVEAIASEKSPRGEERREENTPVVPKGTDDGFERFRSAYPKRNVAFPTSQARKRYDLALKRGATPGEIEAGARAYAAEQARIGKAGTEFVKTADVWLNQERWKDHSHPPAQSRASLSDAEGAYLAGLPDIRWRTAIEHWKRTAGAWDLTRHTPPPDDPRTKVPQRFLDEYGIKPWTPAPDVSLTRRVGAAA